MRSLLEEIASTFRDAIRNGEQGGHLPLLAVISMTLSAASRANRRAAEREMKRILNCFLRRDMYHVTFYFQEIVPIIGHYDIEDFMIYVMFM